VTFWVFGADGISSDKAYEKRALLIGPGQREAVLLQFSKPGNYRIMQLIINGFQNQGETVGDDIEPAATIMAHAPGEGSCSSNVIDPVDLP
jgi:FtsP/CotA-like multicopper oxidase with cupredoxin domain